MCLQGTPCQCVARKNGVVNKVAPRERCEGRRGRKDGEHGTNRYVGGEDRGSMKVGICPCLRVRTLRKRMGIIDDSRRLRYLVPQSTFSRESLSTTKDPVGAEVVSRVAMGTGRTCAKGSDVFVALMKHPQQIEKHTH